MRTAVFSSFLILGLVVVAPAHSQAPPAGTGPSKGSQGGQTLPPFIKPLPADAPKPSQDGRDFRGVWMKLDRKPEQLRSVDGMPPSYTPEAAKLQSMRSQAAHSGKPIANDAVMCRPAGFLWDAGIAFFPIRVMQDERQMAVIFERFHAVWRIKLDRQHSKDIKPTYMGDSVGHWEGNTLVVDTVGLRNGLWLDDSGSYLSDQAHLISRITKNSESQQLQILTTIDDPKTYTKPWTLLQAMQWRPDYAVLADHDCEETAGSAEEAKQFGYTVLP